MLVQIEDRAGRTSSFESDESFRIGRGPRCELVIASPYVSRIHVHVTLENNVWWITDLASSNGTYKGGEPVDRVRIELGQPYYLSKRGPRLTFFDSDTRAAGRDAVGPRSSEAPKLSLLSETTTSMLPLFESGNDLLD